MYFTIPTYTIDKRTGRTRKVTKRETTRWRNKIARNRLAQLRTA